MTPRKLPSVKSVDSLRMVGVSHRTADLGVRSALTLNPEVCREILSQLKTEGIAEAFALSTCNRTEIYFVGSDAEPVIALLSQKSSISVESLHTILGQEEGWSVVRHLFSVGSGLKSAAVGESEILGQLKCAFQLARECGSVGKILDPLIQRTLRASKRVRSESDLGHRGLSLSAVAVKRALTSTKNQVPQPVLVIGSGQIAESIVKNLRHQDAVDVTICSRTFEKAITLAHINGFKAAPFANLNQEIAHAKIVISALTIEEPIIDEEMLKSVVSPNTVLIDLGVPPNVSSAAKNRPDLTLVQIEELMSDVSLNAAQIAEVTPKAMAIVEEEVGIYAQECIEREAAPCIEALVQQSERVRRQNLEWALAQIPVENARERKLLEDLSIRIARGMISEPIRNLKTDFQEPSERAVLARFFQAEA